MVKVLLNAKITDPNYLCITSPLHKPRNLHIRKWSIFLDCFINFFIFGAERSHWAHNVESTLNESYLKNFPYRELALIKTCCWMTDHEILIHDGDGLRELIFISARQYVLISDNSPIRKNISIQALSCRMKMQGYSDVFQWTLLRQTTPEVKR